MLSIKYEELTKCLHQFFIILGISINNCSSDADARFQLAITANDLVLAYQIALEVQNVEKWKQLRELARANSNFDLIFECHEHITGTV